MFAFCGSVSLSADAVRRTSVIPLATRQTFAIFNMSIIRTALGRSSVSVNSIGNNIDVPQGKRVWDHESIVLMREDVTEMERPE